jgi:hypothetical protein
MAERVDADCQRKAKNDVYQPFRASLPAGSVAIATLSQQKLSKDPNCPQTMKALSSGFAVDFRPRKPECAKPAYRNTKRGLHALRIRYRPERPRPNAEIGIGTPKKKLEF